jgi:hypothetical protein
MEEVKVNPHNACIITFFMDNLDIKTIEKQRQVVEKFNKSKVPHYSIKTDLRHGASMDLAWALNGVSHDTFKGHEIAKKFDHDIILFLDADAIPLNDKALDFTIADAARGALCGNIQRSNHINNNQHVFVAPSLLAISVESFVTIGKPTGLEIPNRGDVAEEYTYAAEKSKIVPIDYYMPLRYDEKPAECASWALKDGMPVYGRGTTFGIPAEYNDADGATPAIEMFWHNFQSFHPGQQEKFMKKCEDVLNG